MARDWVGPWIKPIWIFQSRTGQFSRCNVGTYPAKRLPTREIHPAHRPSISFNISKTKLIYVTLEAAQQMEIDHLLQHFQDRGVLCHFEVARQMEAVCVKTLFRGSFVEYVSNSATEDGTQLGVTKVHPSFKTGLGATDDASAKGSQTSLVSWPGGSGRGPPWSVPFWATLGGLGQIT